MLPTEALLVVYYLGLGFIALLGWASIAHDLNKPFDDKRRTPWRRASLTLATLGLLHPAVAFIARDIAVQVDRQDVGQRTTQSTRAVLYANGCTVASLIVAGAFLVIQT